MRWSARSERARLELSIWPKIGDCTAKSPSKSPRPACLSIPIFVIDFFERLRPWPGSNIRPVYEVDEIDGLCYLVLAYCNGPSLDQWFAKQTGPLDNRTAVRLILPLVEAVEHAHARGILHRDIKPANILLATEDTENEL